MKCDCICHMLPSENKECKCCLVCQYCNKKLITNYKMEKDYYKKCKEVPYISNYHDLLLKYKGYKKDEM